MMRVRMKSSDYILPGNEFNGIGMTQVPSNTVGRVLFSAHQSGRRRRPMAEHTACCAVVRDRPLLSQLARIGSSTAERHGELQGETLPYFTGLGTANENPMERSCAMKMNSAQIRQTLTPSGRSKAFQPRSSVRVTPGSSTAPPRS